MRTEKLSILLLTAAVFCCIAALPASAQKPYVYDFLRNDASARSSAMGGSFVSVTGDPVGLYYNPATLNTIDSAQISFTFFKHLLDINSGFATYADQIDGIGKFGVGVNFNTYGAFDRTDRNGQVIGEFGSNDIALTLGWSTELGESVSAGVSAEGVYSGIDDYSSFALALGGGLLWVDTTNNVEVGVSILHLGSQVSSFGDENEELPVDLKVGATHALRGLPLLLSVNFSRLLDPTDDFLDRFSAFSVGGEFTISKPIRLRVGYNNRLRNDLAFGASKGLGGFSGGLGIVVDDYRVDYAFNSMARLGGFHRLSVNVAL